MDGGGLVDLLLNNAMAFYTKGSFLTEDKPFHISRMGGMADRTAFLHGLVDRFFLEIIFLLWMAFEAEVRTLGNELLRIGTGHLMAASTVLKNLMGFGTD